jgi:hypothetical protein
MHEDVVLAAAAAEYRRVLDATEAATILHNAAPKVWTKYMCSVQMRIWWHCAATEDGQWE